MFDKTTEQGHEIIGKGRYLGLYGRAKFIIFHRKTLNDYNIGLNYNEIDGTWAQGVYDFKTYDDAIRWIENNKHTFNTEY